MIKKIQQFILKYKYYHSNKKIYVVGLWADWTIIPCVYAGYKDKSNDPLIIMYSDHNGLYESYYITQWYKCTSGSTLAYFFNKQEALILVDFLKNHGV